MSDIEKELRSLNPNKAYTFKNIPPKILKESREYCSDILQKLFNKTLSNKELPDELKLADVTPIYKKNDPNKSKNYRPVSVLPVVSKVFEKIMHDQISQYINSFLTQFLLIAKLHAYGLSKESLKLIKSYLSNRWQRTKVNLSFSSWSELILGVPQGSVLGPLLFNIYINDLFYLTELTDVCNYADDTTFHACDSNLDDLIRRLEHDSVLAIEWFESNYMKLNQDKCHFLLSGHKHEVMFAKIGHSKIWENCTQKLLGIIIDRNLKFDEYILTQCKKAGRKIKALARVCTYLSLERRRTLMKAFIESQFAYCPLIWMFCQRSSNIRINHLHERALRIVYKDNESTFEDLLKKDNSVSIHHKNIRLLGIELYKVKNNLSTHLMSEIFNLRNIDYNLRSQTDFKQGPVNTVNYGLKSLRYLAPKIWDIIPLEIRNAGSLTEFITNIKSWIPKHCPCTLCRIYIQHVGYIA